jgi:hypothetical protein
MSNTVAVKLFDYAALPADLADDARKIADRIRSRVRASYIETGRDLIDMKAKLGHGRFGPWIAAEFAINERTAENYMNAATFLEGKSETLSVLPPTVIYALAAPSAPASLVNEIVDAAKDGAVLDAAEIKAKLATAKDATRRAAAEAKKTPEEREKERRKLALRETLDKKRDAEIKAREAEQEAKASRVASFLVDLLDNDGVKKLFALLSGTNWSCVELLLTEYRDGRRDVRGDLSKFRTPHPLFVSEDDAAIRQNIVDSLNSAIRSLDDGIFQTPSFVIEAIQGRVWAKPRKLMYSEVPPMSFREFIRAARPSGLNMNVERLRELLTLCAAKDKPLHHEREKALAAEALTAFEAELAREDGRT